MSPDREQSLETLRTFPDRLEALVCNLTDEQRRTHYVDSEWCVQQIVHHVADSHMNSFIRLRLMLTEDSPSLKAYSADAWADLPDVDAQPIEVSIALLKALHARWVTLFASLTDEQWGRSGVHTEVGTITAAELLPMYADHGEEHIAQIKMVLGAGGIRV